MKRILIIIITATILLSLLTIATPVQAQGVEDCSCPCCCESVNPHGQKIPPAGWSTEPGTNPNSGKNPDGFYGVCIPCDCTLEPEPVMYVSYEGSDDPTLFGPFDGCLFFKLTEAKGIKEAKDKKIGSTQGRAGAVPHHFLLPADAVINFYQGDTLIYQTTCVVPPPPK